MAKTYIKFKIKIGHNDIKIKSYCMKEALNIPEGYIGQVSKSSVASVGTILQRTASDRHPFRIIYNPLWPSQKGLLVTEENLALYDVDVICKSLKEYEKSFKRYIENE